MVYWHLCRILNDLKFGLNKKLKVCKWLKVNVGRLTETFTFFGYEWATNHLPSNNQVRSGVRVSDSLLPYVAQEISITTGALVIILAFMTSCARKRRERLQCRAHLTTFFRVALSYDYDILSDMRRVTDEAQLGCNIPPVDEHGLCVHLHALLDRANIIALWGEPDAGQDVPGIAVDVLESFFVTETVGCPACRRPVNPTG